MFIQNQLWALAAEAAVPRAILFGVLVGSAGVAWFFFGLRRAQQQQQKRKTTQVPCAPETSILKSVRELTSARAPWFLLDQARKGNSFVYRLALPGRFYVVGDAALARAVYTHPTCEKAGGHVGQTSKTTGTVNMFNSRTTSAHLKLMRKSTAPAFSSREVHRMNQVCLRHVERWIETRLEPLIEAGDSFDPAVEMKRLTMRVICDAAFEYEIMDEEIDEYLSSLSSCLQEFGQKQIFNPFRRIFGSFIPEVRRAMADAFKTRDLSRRILKNYREKKMHRKQETDENESSNTLIRLIAENTNLTDAERMGEIGVFLIAGHDTTGYTLSSALTILAEYPDVAKKLQMHLRQSEHDHSDNENRSVEECWRKCDYLQYVIRENYRYLPVAALGSLRTLDCNLDFKWQGKDHTIPRGSSILLSQILLHRNDQVFGGELSADTFDPDRWSHPTAEMNAHMSTVFAMGVRNCIGQALATAEVQSTLPRLMRHYTFSIETKGTPMFFFTMRIEQCRLSAKRVVD